MTDTVLPNRMAIALIGYGEAAASFVPGWRDAADPDLRAFDVKTGADPESAEAMRARYARDAIAEAADPRAALDRADLVFSLVTADQAHAAATEVAAALDRPVLFFDCNSCAPQTKQRSAALIEAAGGRYVDVAVMAPVHPLGHRTPMLVSGPHAREALDAMQALGMAATEAEGPVGSASSIKLCRSIVIKGLEALAAEFMLTAETLGVRDEVLASLERSHPGFGWSSRAPKMLERMMVHGRRRAAEMEEAALMVAEAGLPAQMATATAAWQGDIGARDLAPDGIEPDQTLARLHAAFVPRAAD